MRTLGIRAYECISQSQTKKTVINSYEPISHTSDSSGVILIESVVYSSVVTQQSFLSKRLMSRALDDFELFLSSRRFFVAVQFFLTRHMAVLIAICVAWASST